jgi:hypothetical protein
MYKYYSIKTYIVNIFFNYFIDFLFRPEYNYKKF